MPFVKGKSGNPLGRRIDKTPVTDLMRRALAQNNAEKARRLADALIDRAITESDKAACEVLDRTEGKVTQPIGGDPAGVPIAHRVELVIVDPSKK